MSNQLTVATRLVGGAGAPLEYTYAPISHAPVAGRALPALSVSRPVMPRLVKLVAALIAGEPAVKVYVPDRFGLLVRLFASKVSAPCQAGTLANVLTSYTMAFEPSPPRL